MRRLIKPWCALLLAVALLAGGCAMVPVMAPVPVVMSAEQRAAHNVKVFDRAWDLVNRKFFDAKLRGVDWAAMRERYRPVAEKAADEDALYATINSMLAELKESHVAAFSPEQWFEQNAHQRALVGISFGRLESQWVVTAVFPGSPAEAAGVQRGWLAVARDGKPLGEVGFRLNEGQTAVYEFLDQEDRRHALTMTARVISTAIPPEARPLDDGTVYLRFDQFDWKSLSWLSHELRTHRTAPAVVIDLRNNPGGLAIALDYALGEFFPSPVPIGSFVSRSGTAKNEAASQFFSARYAGKVALLVGPGSASCAEIFAHVLQHLGRATVVGRKTAGAVIGSYFYSLPAGGRLQVAIEDYLGVTGQRLEQVGVTPDVVVPLRLADLRAGIDAELNAALSQLSQPPARVAQNR